LTGIRGFVDKSRFMGDHRLRELRFRHRRGEM
jgi:lysozyme